jgi:hypothetical protein
MTLAQKIVEMVSRIDREKHQADNETGDTGEQHRTSQVKGRRRFIMKSQRRRARAHLALN